MLPPPNFAKPIFVVLHSLKSALFTLEIAPNSLGFPAMSSQLEALSYFRQYDGLVLFPSRSIYQAASSGMKCLKSLDVFSSSSAEFFRCVLDFAFFSRVLT